MDTLPDDTLSDTQPVRTPVVYVVMMGIDRYDHDKWVSTVFTSKEKLLEKVNETPNLKGWIDDDGRVQIQGSFWYSVDEIELDKWE